MARRGVTILACLVLAGGGEVVGDETRGPLAGRQAAGSTDVEIDPRAIFDELVARYSELSVYEDSVVVEQVTIREGEESQRTTTKIMCMIDEEGGLTVRTPASQIRDAVRENIGVGSATPISHALATLRMRYNLWLAPHMGLRFNDDPLAQFRLGIDEGFTPVKAERVVVDDADLVRMDLKSGDGLSEDSRATFSLFVDPESMLVVRVEGSQLLPDGASYETVLDITPVQAATPDRTIVPRPRKITTAA